jgi:predicted branched-subunit amino acid permease
LTQHETPRQAIAPGKAEQPTARALFGRGFVGLMPLWTGAIPVGIAYAVAARAVGLSFFETQLMSLTVFSAAAQLSAVSLIASGTPVVILILTALTLNLQLFLYGVTAARENHPSVRRRLLPAYFLTDGAFAVAVAGGRIRLPVLLGAGVSMFSAWNAGTLIGASAGAILPDLTPLGVDFVAPLTFLAVLVPLVRSRPALLTVMVAAITALVLNEFIPDLVVLGAGVTGGVAGAWSLRRSNPSRPADAANVGGGQ